MSNASFGTRVIGYPEYVSLRSKKSAVISNDTIITDIDDISSYAQNLMGWTTPNHNIVTSIGDISENFNIFGEYYPEINLSILSAGTYQVNPVKTVGVQINNPTGNATDISCDIKYSSYINISSSNFESISFPSLIKHSGGNGIDIFNNPNLQTISLPLLEEISFTPLDNWSMQINGESITDINLPLLKNGSLTFTGNTPSTNPINININSLENPTRLVLVNFVNVNIDFSAIKTTYEFFVAINGYVNEDTIISLPNLNYVKKIIGVSNPNISLDSGELITSFEMPNVIEYDDNIITFFNNCNNLSNIIFGTVGILKKANSPYIDLRQAATLTSVQAELTISPFVSLDGTNGTTLSENGTLWIDLTETPSTILQGYFDTLTARGWSVIIND